LAIHLLNQTLDRVESLLKIVVHKFKENLVRTYATKGLIERMKRNKIVIQELYELKLVLGFCNVNGNLIIQK
jgi:hypothetical protein